ncbi:hypothetical protein T484DRAFT_1664889, partial [Baffinella frigidus]
MLVRLSPDAMRGRDGPATVRRLLRGGASCGAWVCFEEPEAAGPTAVACIAHQILTVLLALRAKSTEFELDGYGTALDPSFAAILVTSAPSDGPASRHASHDQRLSDSLKWLFRPVVLLQPDFAAEVEVVLLSAGFSNAHRLAQAAAAFQATAQESGFPPSASGPRVVMAALCRAATTLRSLPAAFTPDDRASSPLGGNIETEEESQEEEGRFQQPGGGGVQERVIAASLYETCSLGLTAGDAQLLRGLVRECFPEGEHEMARLTTAGSTRPERKVVTADSGRPPRTAGSSKSRPPATANSATSWSSLVEDLELSGPEVLRHKRFIWALERTHLPGVPPLKASVPLAGAASQLSDALGWVMSEPPVSNVQGSLKDSSMKVAAADEPWTRQTEAEGPAAARAGEEAPFHTPGVALVGACGCGKTTLLHVLAAAASGVSLGSRAKVAGVLMPVRIFTVSPGSLSFFRLFGGYAEVSGPKAKPQWTDGVATRLVRMAAAGVDSIAALGAAKGPGSPGASPRRLARTAGTRDPAGWVVFDGNLDARWAETLNSSLDGALSWCLPSAERIILPASLRLVFETAQLSHASPSFVGKIRVVHVPDVSVSPLSGIERLLEPVLRQGGLQKRNREDLLKPLREDLSKALEFLHVECKFRGAPRGLCDTVCALLARMAEDLLPGGGQPSFGDVIAEEGGVDQEAFGQASDQDRQVKMLMGAAAFALVWGMGGHLEENSASKFNDWARDHITLARFPGKMTVFDYWIRGREAGPPRLGFAPEQAGGWGSFAEFKELLPVDPWAALPGKERTSSRPETRGESRGGTGSSLPGGLGPAAVEVIVPTETSARIAHLLGVLCDAGRGALLVGNAGTGKTTLAHAAAARVAESYKSTARSSNNSPVRRQHTFKPGVGLDRPMTEGQKSEGPGEARRIRASYSRAMQLSRDATPEAVQKALEDALERDPRDPHLLQPAEANDAGQPRTLIFIVDDVYLPLSASSSSSSAPASNHTRHLGSPLEMLRALVDTPSPVRPGGADNPPHAGGGGFYAESDGAWTDVAGALLLLTSEPHRGGGGGGVEGG